MKKNSEIRQIQANDNKINSKGILGKLKVFKNKTIEFPRTDKEMFLKSCYFLQNVTVFMMRAFQKHLIKEKKDSVQIIQNFIQQQQKKRFEHKLLSKILALNPQVYEELIYFLESDDLIKMIENNNKIKNELNRRLYVKIIPLFQNFLDSKMFFSRENIVKVVYMIRQIMVQLQQDSDKNFQLEQKIVEQKNEIMNSQNSLNNSFTLIESVSNGDNQSLYLDLEQDEKNYQTPDYQGEIFQEEEFLDFQTY